MTKEEALDKLQRYCAYQDRSHKEVRSKLLSLKIYGDWLEEILSQLITDGYLNEERYAVNYARGKYRIKGWGKIKIKQHLKAHYISDYCIRKAMKEIDEEGGYEETLKKHLTKYIQQRHNKYSRIQLRKKAYEHGLLRGFESEFIGPAIAEVMAEIEP